MTEEIDYRKDSIQDETNPWALGGTTSELSASNISRTSQFQGSPYSLQIIPKHKEEWHRPLIKAKTDELLAFFRMYVSSLTKTHVFSVWETGANKYFWYNIQHLIFNSLPHTFVQVFLAAYVPIEHFYLNKMNPLLYGYNFIVIYAAFFELLMFVDINSILMDYLWNGIIQKNPWNRCSSKTVYIGKDPLNCYTLEQVSEKMKNATIYNQTLYFGLTEYYMKTENGIEYFQLPQLLYFHDHYLVKRLSSFQDSAFMIYFIIIWCCLALHYNTFFKKFIWKVIQIANYADITFTMAMTIYVFLSYNVFDPSLKTKVIKDPEIGNGTYLTFDLDLVIEALNTPPVIHVLISRSTADHSQIRYRSFSALIVASNWVYTFTTGFLFNYHRSYCESLLGLPILSSLRNGYLFYNVYPVFFSAFLLGDVFFEIFLSIKLISEFYLLVISYQCLMETIICEWKFITRIMLTAGLAILALISVLVMQLTDIIAMFYFMKTIAVIIEIFGIYILYPLERLIEDVTFQSGNEPPFMQVWSLRVVPVYIAIKAYFMMEVVMEMDIYPHLEWLSHLPYVTLIAGAIYVMYIYLYIEKRNWTRLFCPDSEWGPSDYLKRRCRKLYKKNEYVGSQADRALSRYMLDKTESDVYHLDVKYEFRRKSTATDAFFFQNENEKKLV